ncbi:PEP/pyruvate-binding domain-containing protein [Desulfovibrio inopinatus]|uniref:PEP/pyruvate-binding domain-containing protein n=1 Tax=Desulfovibrio inopinatus TaxID=102109 RepID=UPI0004162E64|nr:PEP/pyruvate-binding domain-containing protein [Desulfovibrio inopinatus]
MRLVCTLDAVSPSAVAEFGGKACSLASMARQGYRVPPTICLSRDAYRFFIESAGLDELLTKFFEQYDWTSFRWEEVWDIALRIRHAFSAAAMPDELIAALIPRIQETFGTTATAIRSSAPEEDHADASFAGLHDSFLDIQGIDNILSHINLVFASLWTDRALLYRRELGLDPRTSAMAVIVQAMVYGPVCGVVFTRDPQREHDGLIEAACARGQDLVDGRVEPARYVMDRNSGHIRSASGHDDVHAILGSTGIEQLFADAMNLEHVFGRPQDVEWVFHDEGIVFLQARPVTTTYEPILDEDVPVWEHADKRPWYRSLSKSLDQLNALHQEVETELIPAMQSEAETMKGADFSRYEDMELAREIERRVHLYEHWRHVYYDRFIPMAHGMRLFAMVYNQALRPDDPYAFMELLQTSHLESLKRNRLLSALADMARSSPDVLDAIHDGQRPDDAVFGQLFDTFIAGFGDLVCNLAWCEQGEVGVLRLVARMAAKPAQASIAREHDTTVHEARYLNAFPEKRRQFAQDVLNIGRASYRLRDDDNIYLGRIEAGLLVAVEEGKKRLKEHGKKLERATSETVAALLSGQSLPESIESNFVSPKSEVRPHDRTERILHGHPAGPGIARGRARVIASPADLYTVEHGDVLVVDALDPNMTFVVPLASAIIERRGGMLIHGAIIAREYGIACVTGIGNATTRIVTGDMLVVDGYTGQVRFERQPLEPAQDGPTGPVKLT